MPTKDLIQEFGKKLKHPQIRVWVHPGRGSDYYLVADPFSKRKLASALVAEPELKGKKGYQESPLVAYGGYEYTPNEFLKKYPKYKLKGKTPALFYKKYLK